MRFIAKIILTGAMLAMVLSGCGKSAKEFAPNTFSDEDMCVVKSDGGAKICYGDSKQDAEAIVGEGKKADFGTSYDFGLVVMYRNDKVAGFALREDSKEVYETTRGAKIGMTKSKMKSSYGEKYSIDPTPDGLSYAYDPKNKRFLGEVSFTTIKGEDAEGVYAITAGFDGDRNATIIMVGDMKMLKYFA